MRALLEIFVVTIIIDGLIVGECVSRGQPQGGRALFSDIDFDSGDVSSSSSIVNSSSFVEIRTFDSDFGLEIRILTSS